MHDGQRSATIISTILKHDRKVTSYKIALIRAINDIALSFPDLAGTRQDVAVPLWMLAEWWIAYYWPFVASDHPILQGPQSQMGNRISNDMAFRPALSALRQAWEAATNIMSSPADGFFVRSELRLSRRHTLYPAPVLATYSSALKAIIKTLEMPIRYAGPAGEQWTIFPKPARFAEFQDNVAPVPGTQSIDVCLRVSADLWQSFGQMAHWIEALCIHEWCLFTETIQSNEDYDRGSIFTLLTARPDNRRPLTWERHQIDMLLMDGVEFICPWTGKSIRQNASYDLDHLIPIALYPTNELWNLIPSDPTFNQHVKRDRLPSTDILVRARQQILTTYCLYDTASRLHHTLHEDVSLRFSFPQKSNISFSETLTDSVFSFIEQLALARNSSRF